jgi:hypothetical protein
MPNIPPKANHKWKTASSPVPGATVDLGLRVLRTHTAARAATVKPQQIYTDAAQTGQPRAQALSARGSTTLADLSEHHSPVTNANDSP